MAAGVTHHFDNLPTGILGGTSNALAALPEDHGVRRELERVVSSSERAGKLVRRLGSYTGRAPRQQRRFAARELLGEPLPVDPLPEGVTITVAAAERLPELEGDLRELRQALGDVLRNAVEAWPSPRGCCAATGARSPPTIGRKAVPASPCACPGPRLRGPRRPRRGPLPSTPSSAPGRHPGP